MDLKNLLELVAVLLFCIIKGLQANIDCNGTRKDNNESNRQKAKKLAVLIYDNNNTRNSENLELSTEESIKTTITDDVALWLFCIIKGLQPNIDCKKERDLEEAKKLAGLIYDNNDTRNSENLELFTEESIRPTITDDFNSTTTTGSNNDDDLGLRLGGNPPALVASMLGR